MATGRLLVSTVSAEPPLNEGIDGVLDHIAGRASGGDQPEREATWHPAQSEPIACVCDALTPGRPSGAMRSTDALADRRHGVVMPPA